MLSFTFDLYGLGTNLYKFYFSVDECQPGLLNFVSGPICKTFSITCRTKTIFFTIIKKKMTLYTNASMQRFRLLLIVKTSFHSWLFFVNVTPYSCTKILVNSFNASGTKKLTLQFFNIFYPVLMRLLRAKKILCDFAN